MKKIIGIMLFMIVNSLSAETCPNFTDFKNPPAGWSLMSLMAVTVPVDFLDARYINSFGVLNGLVICDYLDADGMPFYLMSEAYYPDPRKHEAKAGLWTQEQYPFKYLVCSDAQAMCEF